MIRDILTEENVETDVEAKTWREAVNICGKILLNSEKIDESFIKSMIETVEEFGPYMILLPEIAFFHGKPSAGVKEVCLSLITLKDEVIFDDFENQGIKCAFGFGAVDSDSHINTLVNVTQLLQDEEFLNLIRNNGSKKEIMKKINQY